MEEQGDPTGNGDIGPDGRDESVTGRWVGGLFLAAFALYGVGALLVEGATDVGLPGDVLSSSRELRVGALLIVANSIAVVAIGALMYRLAAPVGRHVRLAYLGARLFEGIFLALGAVAALLLISAAESTSTELIDLLIGSGNATYQIAMIGLCAGSIPLFWTLVNARAMPRWLGVWGAVGYLIFGIGAVLEICGASVGVVLSVPGGIFEVTFAIYLLWRGALGSPTGVEAMRAAIPTAEG